MPEAAANEVFPIGRAPVLLEALKAGTLFALTSYDPQVVRGGLLRRFGPYDLPSEIGTVRPDRPRILCMGPADWLLVFAELASPERYAAANEGWVLTDLSPGYVRLKVSGGRGRRVLSQGCGLDLDASVFVGGHCARTRFAQVPVVIDCVQSPDRFDLCVTRSLGTYLHDWLVDAFALDAGVSPSPEPRR